MPAWLSSECKQIVTLSEMEILPKNNEMVCALAAVCFSDGAASLADVLDQLEIPQIEYGRRYLKDKAKI